MTDWKQGGAAYIPTLASIEVEQDIPTDLLSRVAFQECSWRPDVISGKVKSPAGAVGMFQLMPQFFRGAGVDWHVDAVTAADYLKNLYDRFQDWQLAIAAYNWGPGNVELYVQGKKQVLPFETSNYVAKVIGDVPLSGSIMEIENA